MPPVKDDPRTTEALSSSVPMRALVREAKITVIDGDLKGTTHEFAAERLVIGADPRADFVLDDPASMLSTIVQAVHAAGVRAIISKGWSDFGGEASEDIYYIGDCPHEWLFPRMAAVVHHGGAGTTACGIKNAIPTIIVPFFGE